jgi:hypothetical protein
MFVYLAIVLVGFFYIWKKGVLDWGLSITDAKNRVESRRASLGGQS